MLLPWLVVPLLCLSCVNARGDATFYDYLVSQNASKEMTDIWRDLSMFEGGYQKSVELGFVPTFDQFYRTAISFFPRIFLLKQREHDITHGQSRRSLRIFNISIVDEANKNDTIFGTKHLTHCLRRDRGCFQFLFDGLEKHSIFNETNTLLKHIENAYPDVGADLKRFIDQAKEQYNLLANDVEKAVVLKIAAVIVKKTPAENFDAIITSLSTEERNDVAYHMMWFVRGVLKALYDNMLKK